MSTKIENYGVKDINCRGSLPSRIKVSFADFCSGIGPEWKIDFYQFL